MSVTVSQDFFRGKDAAVSDIAHLGLTPRDGQLAAGDLEDVHWHETSLRIYVLSGSFETKDAASGALLTASAGDLISIPARTLHAARCPSPATYVVGFESADAMAGFRPMQPDAL